MLQHAKRSVRFNGDFSESISKANLKMSKQGFGFCICFLLEIVLFCAQVANYSEDLVKQ